MTCSRYRFGSSADHGIDSASSACAGARRGRRSDTPRGRCGTDAAELGVADRAARASSRSCAATDQPSARSASSKPHFDAQVERAASRGRRRATRSRARRSRNVRRRAVEEHLAVDARVPPLVLVLDVGRVGPPHHLRGEQVRLRRTHVLGDVELGFEARVLADADLGAVDPHVQHAVGAADVQHDAPSLPLARARRRWCGSRPVGFCVRHVRRELVGTASARSCRSAGRSPASSSSPARRRRPTSPSSKSGVAEAVGRGVGPVDEREPPAAVERPEPRAAAVDQRRPHRQPSDARELGLRPPVRHGRSFARTGTVRWNTFYLRANVLDRRPRHGNRRLRRLRRRQPLLRGDRRVHPPPARQHRSKLVQWAEIDGKQRLVVDNKVIRFIPNPTFDPVARPGCLDDYFRGKRAGDDIRAAFGELEPINPAYREPEARVELMDTQGIEGCFLFPTLGVGIEEALLHDPDALHAVFHAFNQWMLDDWTFNYQRPHLRARRTSRCRIPSAREHEVDWALENGAHVIVMRAGPGARSRRSRARPATRCTTRSGPGSPRPASSSRTTRATRLRPLRRRVGRRRRLRGVPQRPVPHRHRRAPPDLRHDRRARVPRRVAPPPEPAGRDDRERLRLGAAAAEDAEEVVRAAARSRSSGVDPVAAAARPRVGVAVLRGRPRRSCATRSAPTA